MKPIIGILSTYDLTNTQIRREYPESILLAGGIPIIIPVLKDSDDVNAVIQRIDGLLIPGGPDIDPNLYDEEPNPQINNFNFILDNFQQLILNAALEKKIPIFGICRGLQILNVYFGGSLYQDIKSQNSNVPNLIKHQQTGLRYALTHFVTIETDSLLMKLLGKERVRVNSLHHQAVKKLADGFKVTARSSDGIIEAIEKIDNSDIYAVQWHPEEPTAHEILDFLPLFKYLVERATSFMNSR